MTPSSNESAEDARLEDIATRWSLLHQANHDPASAARNALVIRYCGAIRRYAGALMGPGADGEDLAQDVLLRLLRGDFAVATPDRGRFRDLLKHAIRNMARDYWRRQRRMTPGLPSEAEADVRIPEQPSSKPWKDIWREALLTLTWKALQTYEQQQPGSVSYTVLRLRTAHPDVDMEAFAAQLTTAVGRPFTSEATRQQLHRARRRFIDCLLEEIKRGLDQPTPGAVQQELQELGLVEYLGDLLPGPAHT